jgi:hypothetical protein
LYPKPLIDALGGVEAFEKLREIDGQQSPPLACNLESHRNLLMKEGYPVWIRNRTEAIRGKDRAGRPFLELYLHNRKSIVYYAKTDAIPGTYAELANWQFGPSDGSWALNFDSPQSKFALQLLQIFSSQAEEISAIYNQIFPQQKEKEKNLLSWLKCFT